VEVLRDFMNDSQSACIIYFGAFAHALPEEKNDLKYMQVTCDVHVDAHALSPIRNFLLGLRGPKFFGVLTLYEKTTTMNNYGMQELLAKHDC